MYAVTITKPGGPEVLVLAEVPDPVPGPGEVLIDVVASAVNRADLLQRSGFYDPPPGIPPYPGLECAGTIAGFGPPPVAPPGAGEPTTGRGPAEPSATEAVAELDAVDPYAGWQVGDRVCALLAGGGYAQRVAVPVGQLLPIPTGVPLIEAAALPEVACTVWSNLTAVARLSAGQSILIHGGGSGIGTFAIQYAAALGAEIYTTARVAKHEQLRALGAHHTIDYTEQDFAVEVDRRSGGHGVDVILDIQGGSYLERNVASLANGGHLVIIGLQGGRQAELNLGLLMAKRASITATTLRARPPAEKAQIVAGVRAEVWPLIESGRIRPVIDRSLPLADARLAHELVASNAHVGKVLLITGD